MLVEKVEFAKGVSIFLFEAFSHSERVLTSAEHFLFLILYFFFRFSNEGILGDFYNIFLSLLIVLL